MHLVKTAGEVRRLMVALALTLVAVPGAAHADARVALVVGNAAYAAQVGPLANPVKDATLIADALEARQFVVSRAVYLDRVRLLAAVDAYAHRLAEAGPGAIGFLYYSGHGAANQDNGRNYLIPVDAQSASDSRLWYQSVPLQEIIETIGRIAPQAANVVVFDACRDALRLPGGKTLGDGGKGLRRETARPSVLIAFSTSPDATAADLDRSAATGPYATELAAALAKPGVDLEVMFSDVKYGVLSRTGDKQLPYIENGLRARVVLNGGTQPSVASTDPYARWGLTARDFSVNDGNTLLDRAGAAGRLPEIARAAEAGDIVAQTLVGLAYFQGIGTGRDDMQALRWSKKAADAGNARAMNTLSALYVDGRAVPQNYATALSWQRKAAELGNAYAMKNTGVTYDIGRGVPQNFVEAMRWYRKAADLGEPQAMNAIGVLYGNGQGVPLDYAEAMRWYRKAADLGQATAMTRIGLLYATGEPVGGNPFANTEFAAPFTGPPREKQDFAEAMRWYRKAAELGEPIAMGAIGSLYANGEGVKQDFAEALRWYRKSADLGESKSMTNIGFLYANGQGMPQDNVEAMRWFRKAAELEEPAAMSNIAYYYEKGIGVPQDYVEARRWYARAAALGNKVGKDSLERLTKSGH